MSLIIVSYNVPELLMRCISSIKAARRADQCEIIVVDNNSTDNGRETIVSKYKDILWIQNADNVGFAAAVNIGLSNGKGSYFMLINPDSEISQDALEVVRDFWNEYPDAGIVGGKIVSFDGSFQKQCRRNFPRPASAFFKLFRFARLFPDHAPTKSYELNLARIDEFHEVEAVSGAFMSFSRNLVEEIGMFDEGYFLMGEDLDYCFRSVQAGHRNYYLPDAVMTHHHGASRSTRPFRSIYHGHQAMMRYYRKFLKPDYSALTSGLVYSGILIHFIFRCLSGIFSETKKVLSDKG